MGKKIVAVLSASTLNTRPFFDDDRSAIEILNDKFIDAEQFVHQAITNKSKKTKSLWRAKIKTGKFEYGRGYIMKSHSFYGGKELTDSTADWYQMVPSRAPGTLSGEDPGFDACRYDPAVVGYGFEEKTYTLYETTRRTEDICLRDLQFKWKFEEQLRLIFNSLADVTLGVWEKWLRETYINFSEKLVVAEGMPSFATAMGAREIALNTIDTDIEKIGLLNQETLDKLYQYLGRQCPMACVAQGKNGMPVFGLITSMETSTEIIETVPVRREDMRYLRPEYLVEGYGTVEGYKNFAHIHDMESPRYVLSADGTKLERVFPFKFTPTSIGEAVNISKEYVDAPFEMSIIFLTDVFTGLVPDPVGNVAGASFGGVSNLGDFNWINIKERENNMLGEKGFMFARYNCAPKPEANVDNAVVLLHRRPASIPVYEVLGAENPIAAATDTNVVTMSAVADDGDVSYDEIEVVLEDALPVRIGAAVTVTALDDTETAGIITKDYQSGRYRVAFAAEADWVTDLNTGATNPAVTVKTA